MGMDPVTIGLGLSAAGSIYGAISGNNAAKRTQDISQQNFTAQQAHQKQIMDLITPYLGKENGGIDALINGRGGSDFNTGQDGLMQMMRAPAQFDTSKLFDSIRATSGQDLTDQLVQSRASAGSLGERFGTAQGRNEALLRSRTAVGTNAAYTQAGQSAFESAQGRSLTAAQIIAQLTGQKNNNTTNLLGLIAGQGTPQQQAPPVNNSISEGIGDIGNLAILYPFLRGMQAPATPNYNTIGQQYRPIFPSFG